MPVNQNIANFLVYCFAAVILAMLIVSLLPKNCSAYQTEGFATASQSSSQPGAIMTFCPQGTKSYTDREGNTNCCNGQVNGANCEGRIQCTLSGNASRKYPLCRVPPPLPKPRTIKSQAILGVGKDGKLYSSSNPQSWKPLSSGSVKLKTVLQRPFKLLNKEIVSGELVGLGLDGKLYQGSDNGVTWTKVQRYNTTNLIDIAIEPSSVGMMYGISTDKKVYTRPNLASPWSNTPTNLNMSRIFALNDGLVGIADNKLHTYSKKTRQWKVVDAWRRMPQFDGFAKGPGFFYMIGKDGRFYENKKGALDTIGKFESSDWKVSSTINSKQLVNATSWTVLGR